MTSSLISVSDFIGSPSARVGIASQTALRRRGATSHIRVASAAAAVMTVAGAAEATAVSGLRGSPGYF
jgi:hypothetical protein